MKLDHSNRARAKLNVGGAKQWLNCPPDIKANEDIADKNIVFVEEGIFAHELSKLYFSPKYEGLMQFEFNKVFQNYKRNQCYNEELRGYVKGYVVNIEEKYNEALSRNNDIIALFETRLDLGKYILESFGTGDVIIFSGDVLEIIDPKYSRGIEVSTIDNPQLRLYGLGAYELLGLMYDIHTTRVTTMQPRMDNSSTEELPISRLLQQGAGFVKPLARLAYDGGGEFKAGSHCRFCKINHSCRTRAEYMQGVPQEPPHLLSNEEIVELLYRLPDIKKRADEVERCALSQAKENDKNYPSWELIEGCSRKMITDTEAMLERLVEVGHKPEDIIEIKLPSVTNLEKLIGKKVFSKIIEGFIEKPQGRLTFTTESDKRPTIKQSTEDDFDKL